MQHSLLRKLLFFTLFFIELHAEVAYNEQILTNNGGDGVAINHEWAFVGDADECLVYIYKIDYTTMEFGDDLGSAGTPFQELGTNCNANGYRSFGASISNSGDTLLIGAPGASKVGVIHVYTYNAVTDEWEQVTSNKGLEGPGVQDGEFGASVSVRQSSTNSNELLVIIGAPKDGTNNNVANNTGKAYVYTYANDVRTLSFLQEYSGSQAGEQFGFSVTSDGRRFLVGAPFYDLSTLEADVGRVFYYPSSAFTSPNHIYYGVTPLAQRGKELSLSAEYYMLMSGNISTALEGSEEPPTTIIKEFLGANGGDVSQSDGVVAMAVKGTSVHVIPDINDSSPLTPSPSIIIEKVQTNFGEDINLYKEQLVVNGDINNEAYVYDFPCGIKPGKLNAFEWAMVSVPCGDGTATIGEIFGDDLGIYGDNDNWVMYGQDGTEWSGTSASMRQLQESDTMELGKGYWIITDANKTWKVDNTAVTTRTQLDTTTITSPPTTVGGYYFAGLPVIVSGETKKLMYGNPFPRAFKWKDLQVGRSGVYGPFDTSIVYNPTGYVYDTSSQEGQPYRAITANTPGISDQIEPYEAFWIQETEEDYDFTGYELAIPFEK